MLHPTPPDQRLDDMGRPYFLWDLDWTEDRFRRELADADDDVRVELVAKLMRQAKPDDVFEYVELSEVLRLWERLVPRLACSEPSGFGSSSAGARPDMSEGSLTSFQRRLLVLLAEVRPRWRLTGGAGLAGFHAGHGAWSARTGVYSVKGTGPLIWFGGSLRPPEPEELGPPPPLPRPTPAEKLFDQRRTYLRKVDAVAAGVHLAIPSYAYTVDLTPSEAKDLADAEARWIDEHGALPYDPDEVEGYTIPELNPLPVRTTGTFPLPAQETAEP